nr:MAG TPA: hypothetical protein [Caudoviricetes sp.]
MLGPCGDHTQFLRGHSPLFRRNSSRNSERV